MSNVMDTRKCSDSFLTNSMLQGEEDPWKKAKEYKDSIITKESMFEYYSSLLDVENRSRKRLYKIAERTI